MNKVFIISILSLGLVTNWGYSQNKTSTTGPVFKSMGPVYDLPYADFVPDSTQLLKAIFDIERLQEDPGKLNPLISSLHRYYNMHVKNGIPEKNIYLAFVLHGASSKDALTNEAYRQRYGVNNPNYLHIKALAIKGVKMYVCGQSATYAGFKKRELLPEVKMALSAMSVLTVFQMNGYAMIRF